MADSTTITDLKLSAEATVETDEGFMNAFQLNTYAVRAEFSDGTVVVRMLDRGLASRENMNDPAFRNRVAQDLLREKQEAVA